MLVKIARAANCDLGASATWGSVKSAFSLAGDAAESTPRRIKGRLNGGGPLLSLRANGGSVKIEPGEMLYE